VIDTSATSGVRRSTKIIREIVETIILTVLIFLLVRLAVQNFRVDGTSMLPTVQNGDLVLVNKVDYLVGSPQRGDIIVFHFPLQPSEDFIKRVIGVPGDVIKIRDAKLYVNNRLISQSYEPTHDLFLDGETVGPGNYNWGPETVPAHDYFVLGDNRQNSYDSHLWEQNGHPEPWVPRRDIIGKALVAYWPILTCHWNVIIPSDCNSDFQFFSF